MCVAPTVPYQPRASHLSALHEILLDHHEKFESVYDERYSRRYGPLRPQVGDAFRRFPDCGVLAHGFLRMRCRSHLPSGSVLARRTRPVCLADAPRRVEDSPGPTLSDARSHRSRGNRRRPRQRPRSCPRNRVLWRLDGG